MRLSKLVLAFLLFALCCDAVAQPMFYFRNLDVANGLPSNVIYSFCQDRQGSMWIGTRDRLVRYDGVAFEKFYHDPLDTNSIGGNSISWDMQEDAKGRIWISLHGKGLSRFEPRTGKFSNFSFANGRFEQAWTNDAEQLIMMENGSVLLICQRGIVEVDTDDKVSVLVDLSSEKSISDVGTFRFGALHEQRWLWLTTSTQILCFDLQTRTWESISNNPRKLTILHRKWMAHGALYHEGKLWFSTYFKPAASADRFLYSFDLDKNRLDSIAIAPNVVKKNPFSDQVHAIHIQKDGTIWLGTEGIGLMGLLAYNPKTEKWIQYYGNLDWKGSLLPGAVTTLFEDDHRNIWIGTDRGISLMAQDRQYFKNYAETTDVFGNKFSLSETYSVCSDRKGNIWLAEDGNGMLQMGADLRVLKRWKQLPNTAGNYRDYLEPRVIKPDTLIFHNWYNGLSRLDLKTGKVFNFSPITDVGRPELRQTFVSHSGQVYGYGWGRFGKLNVRTGQFDHVDIPLNNEGRPDLVMAAAEDAKGNMWLGLGQTGLLCIDPNGMQVIDSWKRDPKVSPKTRVLDIICKKEKLYFTFDKEGLTVLDVKSKALLTFSKKDGLCSDELNGILVDKKGSVWAYSSSGISWFDEENKRFRSFNEADGMISENVHDATLLPNGHLLLTTDRGLIVFNPDELKKPSATARPSLRSIQVYDKSLNVEAWKADSSEIRVPYDQNYLRVEFSALEFFDPEKIQFAYRLDGAEERWNYTDHRPVAIYTSLRGGHYKLCVKRTNIDGVWGPELCLPIFVTTPFYLQLWFILLAVLLVAISSFFIYRWQLRKKLAVLEVRNQLSRDLHDDIGSALSSINIFSSVAEQHLATDKAETAKLLQRIGSSARGMMQSMDDIIWSIDPNNDQVEQLLARMRGFAIPILEAKDILLKMDIEEGVLKLKLDMVTRRNLFLIFKETINNLAKYSKGATAQVELQVDQGKLRLTIKDDGDGFDIAQKSERHGLSNMKKRAEELGGSVTISSQKGVGTTVLVEIPIT